MIEENISKNLKNKSIKIEFLRTSRIRSQTSTSLNVFFVYFSGVRVNRSLVLCVMFVDRCLSFFFWPLCCLSFFDIRILITPLVSLNSSYTIGIKKMSFKTVIWLLLSWVKVLFFTVDLQECIKNIFALLFS